MDVGKGYVGLTDPDWYSFLSAHPHVDEVNFWQPHGVQAFRALKPGEPFFFKLRAPLKAIAGFGFFERFEPLPAWLAWESFGEMNGAPDCVFRSKPITIPLEADHCSAPSRSAFRSKPITIPPPSRSLWAV